MNTSDLKNVFKILAIVVAISTLVIGLIGISTSAIPFDDSKILRTGYFYHQSDSCVQSVNFSLELKELMDYHSDYNINGQKSEDGVRFSNSGLYLMPDEVVRIHGYGFINDTVKYEMVSWYQKWGGQRHYRLGYILSNFFQEKPPKNDFIYCNEYLNGRWEDRFGENPNLK